MNRNSKSHFSATDNRINIGRSTFDRPSWWKGSFNASDLVPFYLDEVLPGDSFDMKTSVLARMSTPLFPVMDNCYLDTYFFFVPMRLVWDHWKQFMGENDVNAWTPSVTYRKPSAMLGGTGQLQDYSFTLVDYMGLPTHFRGDGVVTGEYIDVTPFRAYQLIWNEWFRDQNLQDPVLIDKGDLLGYLTPETDYIQLRKVNKFHDYFTSCLPQPQRGSAVLIPGFDGTVPVVTGSDHFGNLFANSSVPYSLHFVRNDTGSFPDNGSTLFIGNNGNVLVNGQNPLSGTATVVPSNLYVGSSSGVTIDALRAAFQVQKLLWRDGNGGSRYTELIRSHFGVVSPDARQQRPEYLGGKRIPITINQVIQQSATVEGVSPQGNTAAYSKTVDSFNGFQKSFTEHGFIIGVCCCRTDHTYQNGINRMWSRMDRLDYYFPEFAHLGETAVLNKEIFYDDSVQQVNNEVFGYQEAWAEYKYRPSFVTGAFRSNYEGGSLDAWHYADDYDTTPTLSAEWIAETPTNVNRTLAVQGDEDNHDQFLVDFYFDLKTTRPMPVYSVPGLVDHF